MIAQIISNAGLELAYDTIAEGIDAAGDKRELFLAKLALILANLVADPDRIAEAVAAAGRDL